MDAAFRMYDAIEKKKHARPLDAAEIRAMVEGYTSGEIPDYQMSAMMMAIYFQGLNDHETAELTLAMRDSGRTLDLSGIPGVKVDKHSTGGVGDKTSIALAPLVSSVGVKVAKMSGRGLGHTGGTIDKLESFPGFRTDLTKEQFLDQVDAIGLALMGQTAELAPADKKLYALRDVTATVDQLSLIASSIMSKKLASGADAIVLDVKWGSGAFMKSLEDARALARAMVRIGRAAGRSISAFLTGMDQPLGRMVGNALEVREAIDTLRGQGPADFTELTLTLGAEMVRLSGICDQSDTARQMLIEAIESGRALEQLARFVTAQGGDAADVYDATRLRVAAHTRPLLASQDGYVQRIDCDQVGLCSLQLGGGRERKEDAIDLSVGIELCCKVGDAVKQGDVLARLYYQDEARCERALKRLQDAYHIGAVAPPPSSPIVLENIVE